MKKLTTITTAFGLFAATLLSGAAMAHTLTVQIDQISEQSGKLHVAVYANAESYEQGKNAAAAQIKPVTADSHQLVFTDLPAGQYAVKLMHDANDNGKLDRNFMGIPSEGYGFSNNAGEFGPASFADAAFDVAADTQLTIHVR
jgi:uncharacterized protein (DUF2141 family)